MIKDFDEYGSTSRSLSAEYDYIKLSELGIKFLPTNLQCFLHFYTEKSFVQTMGLNFEVKSCAFCVKTKIFNDLEEIKKYLQQYEAEGCMCYILYLRKYKDDFYLRHHMLNKEMTENAFGIDALVIKP